MRLRLLSVEEAREAAKGLDEDQREYLAAVAEKLSPEMSGDEVQELLYSAAVERGLKPKKAFAAVYGSAWQEERSQGRPFHRRAAARDGPREVPIVMEDTNTVRGAR